jgi:hypothetical protein
MAMPYRTGMLRRALQPLVLAVLAFGVGLDAAQARPTPPTGAVTGEKPADLRRTRVPAILLKPLPATGGVPRMAPPHRNPATPGEREAYEAQFRALRMRHFQGNGPQRAAGVAAVAAVRDPKAFEALWNVMRAEKDDVRLVALDAFAAGREEGQYRLACIAIQDADKAIRAEATRRIPRPPCQAVLAAIDEGLRAENSEWIDQAGLLAGSVHAIEAIPGLIFAQFAQGQTDGSAREGRSLAWIAIGKVRSYVQNVIPVVGDNSGAYQPVIGQIVEGVVMEVAGCNVTIYHGDVHDSLVAMSSYDSGTDTSHLAWDMRAWWRWFNTEYVPMKQREDEVLAKAAPAVPGGGATPPGAPR